MSANVVRYRSAAFLSSVIGAKRSPRPVNCDSSVRRDGCTRPVVGSVSSSMGVWSALILACAASCTGASLPEPETAATALARAVERRDAPAVHALLDEQSRSKVTVAEVQALLDQNAAEVGKRLAVHARSEATVHADAVLPGGEQVTLREAGGEFYVADTSGLAGVAVTPREALIGLRRALEQPNYGLLLQLLSSDVREAVESQRRALVQALSDVEVVQIIVEGDHAIVNTADGHRVELELESGVWRVRDFE